MFHGTLNTIYTEFYCNSKKLCLQLKAFSWILVKCETHKQGQKNHQHNCTFQSCKYTSMQSIPTSLPPPLRQSLTDGNTYLHFICVHFSTLAEQSITRWRVCVSLSLCVCVMFMCATFPSTVISCRAFTIYVLTNVCFGKVRNVNIFPPRHSL